MKIVIVGGVAGGASAAARLRRLCESCEIILIERGVEPSFANCGLPYYVGGEIESRDRLLVAPVERLRQRYRLDVRVRSEVRSIDRANKTVTVANLATDEVYEETYDKLILATGAAPFRPPIPGIDREEVFELRGLDDADILHAQATSQAKSAAIIGGGFIGIEVAENLVRRGIEVTVIELADQILTPWDPEMVRPLQQQLLAHGIKLLLEESAEAFTDRGERPGMRIQLQSGRSVDADFAVVCIGVRPESQLAVDAGLECGSRGGIVTNAHQQTSDPDIYAVGDVVEVTDFVTGKPTQVPLAGPANRQGRIAADHLLGRDARYRGTQGTSVVGFFGQTAAMTGQNEKMLRRQQTRFEKIYIHPTDHAGYYPGAEQFTLKLLFDPDSGHILGAQAVGTSGVDKRIDVIAMAIQANLSVFDLEEAELCYAPQYGHAKDPVNMAGFVAAGVIRGDQPVIHAESIDPSTAVEDFILDVRSRQEHEAGHLAGATNIPIEELRDRLSELPRDRRIIAYCQVGQRGYMATRLLLQDGFEAVNLSGGYRSWCQMRCHDGNC
ncbi:CoA-disulfide reductase [Roseiconus nitratireducens]|uniref:CoA-disulfide reductase n=1 Tax=Roseiconus nitratireducens TaxID=2605748 RepID=A0A5M6CTG6_9BACT|nr:FAD-dependent oxidoreductase [Roseiconus nitratireducens]KAA5538547.1 CoA-disulfide reductase [Roseiconus nitratireducens]